MARPSSNIDQKLLKAGLELIAQNGSKSLTIRKVCEIAHANLGMFVYFFKNKDNYLKIIFNNAYNEMLAFLDLGKAAALNDLERLKYYFDKTTEFAFQNKNLIRAIFVECALDTKIYHDYIQKGILRPPLLPVQLIEAAQQTGYLRTDLSAFEIHRLFFFSAIMPILFSDSGALLGNTQALPDYNRTDSQKRLAALFKEVEISK